MKNLIITLFILLLSCNKIFPLVGEFWFLIDDNGITNYNYLVVVTRVSVTQPLFGKVNGIDFMEVNSNDYNVVTSAVDGLAGHQPIPYPFDVRRGFDYLRDPGFFPSIGEGYLEINIYQDFPNPPYPHTDLIFSFRLNNLHAESPDIIFEYSMNQPTILTAKARGGSVVTTINYGDNKQIWDLLGDPYQYISSYYNNIQLTNDVNGTAENDIKITFNTAEMGFPDGTGQIGYQYDPGTFVHLWRGVEYGLSTSHSTYTKNNIIYNFRNWRQYEAYTTSATLRVLAGTDEFRSMYYSTIPLTGANNLEGGSSNNDYEITWQTPPITQTWQYGVPFNAFKYETPRFDAYSATASDQFQALGTTWWFHHWDNGSTNAVRPNIQVTAPTTITAYYKGNLRSNDQNGVKNPSQRKMVRTDNGQYHVVYESMGTVWYTYSLTSDFYGAWSQDCNLTEGIGTAKNPAIDYDVNSIKIVFEYYDPQQGGDAKIFLAACEPSGNGTYTYAGSEEVSSYSNSYYGNAKPVVSFTEWEVMVIYRDGPTGTVKQKTKWIDFNWDDEDDIPGTNSDCINPSVTGWRQPGNVAFVFIAYENFGTIYFKQAYRMPDQQGNPYWEYGNYGGHPVNISSLSGFNTNRYPVISLANQNSVSRYLMISWQGIYDPINPLPKTDGSEPLYREAAVVKTGYGTKWGTSSNFSDNVDYTNNGSLNTLYGSIMTWSESDGQYSKYVRRRLPTGYDPITPLAQNGIQTLVSNGTEFGIVKAIVFNNSTILPYLLNLSTNDFTYIPDGMGKITESGVVDISYGRSGIVEKNGIEFVFNIGDVLLNGETIKFIERADTLPIASIAELNLAVKSDTLDLTTESELIFSDYYYVVFGEKADSLLSNEFNVNFKCELVKLSTGEVVGVFEEVNYNKTNLEEFGQEGYLIDCSGIEAGKYYLRLTTAVNEEVNLSLSDIQMDNLVLEKSELNIRNFKGSTIPLEYSLEQNYPNPFNPRTIIQYQIPKDGLVTLKVYDILGAEVATLVNEELVAGKYEVDFNASRLASGVYLYKLQADEFISVKKMVLVK